MQKGSAPRKLAKPTKAAKKTTKVAKKAPLRQQKRKMTIFAGKGAQSEQIFAAGNVKRTQGGQTIEFPMALEFTATPNLNLLTTTQHRFIPGSGLVDTYTEAFLVDAKGESAKVKTMTVEPILKDGAVKFTGPAFAWTKAQIASSTLDGNKIDTVLDFAKDKVGLKLKLSGKEQFEEVGDLEVVEKAQFYDFVRASKASHERMAVVGEENNV